MKRIGQAFVVILAFVLSTAATASAQPQPEAVQRGGGLLLMDQAVYSTLPQADVPLSGTVPSSADLSPEFPPVGDQGQQGSCVGWAVAYLKSFQEKREIGWNFATDNAKFSPSYVYNQIKSGASCEGGTYFPHALNLLTAKGIATAAAFPYLASDCARVITELIHNSARPFRAKSWRRVNSMDVTEVKSHLAAGTPILIGIRFDAAFQRLKQAVYTGITDQVLGGHAMVMVGYDDQKGAFKVINSWGTTWGDQGYGWIAYSVATDPLTRAIVEAYVVEDAPTLPRPVPGEVLVGEGTPLAAPADEVLVEIVPRLFKSAGSRKVILGTRDHHCSSNCAGEPTRTNYNMTLSASPGHRLRNPVVKCLAGSCPWSAVSSIRTEKDDTVALASFDVWSRPTTWELSAEEYEVTDGSPMTQRVVKGTSFTVNSTDNQLPPKVRVTTSTGQSIEFIAGQPPTGIVGYQGRQEVNGVPNYRFAY